MQSEQADADKRIAQAKAEVRRAAAVAVEQEMRAKTQEMRAKVVEAEAQIPQAMAEAFRSGHLGIMDYYRMRNVQADTSMRESIAGTDKPRVGRRLTSDDEAGGNSDRYVCFHRARVDREFFSLDYKTGGRGKTQLGLGFAAVGSAKKHFYARRNRCGPRPPFSRSTGTTWFLCASAPCRKAREKTRRTARRYSERPHYFLAAASADDRSTAPPS